MTLQQITPILRIFSIEKATEFYIDFLGFKVDWQHRFGDNFPLYLQISKDQCILHLSEHYGDGSPGSSIRIQCSDIGYYHQWLEAKDYRFAKPEITRTPWNTQELQITDPFHNHLVFWQG